MPVLDANFLIMLSNDEDHAIRALQKIAGEDLVVPAQAAAEYLVGFDDVEDELSALHESFKVTHTDDEHLITMARLRAEARSRALRPRWGDVHIAAQTRMRNTYVVTTNTRHFRQLDVDSWDWRKQKLPPKTK